MSAAVACLIAVSLDGRGFGQAPGEIARAASRLDAAGVDLLILGGGAPGLDPLVLAGWLAAKVRRAGLVCALPALSALPFHVARALSALDVLTCSRSGWAPGSLGLTDGPGDDASARALDFIEATCALWDSWDAEALVLDKAAGLYLDPARVRRVDYRGPVFQVMGPLNACRPPQGYPVLVQSDADPLWRLTAGRADVLLTGTTEADGLAARRRTVAEAGGQARLLASVEADDRRTALEAADRIAALREEGFIDGVHVAAADAGSIDAIVEGLVPALRRRGLRPQAPKTGSLRAALGLRDHANADPARLRFQPAA